MKRFTTQKQKIGEIGEYIARMFLVKHGFTIIETNYTKKIGEIDIIAKKNSVLHFVEVKSVSRRTASFNVSCETMQIRPEHQFHVKKFRRFAKTVQLYLAEKHVFPKTWPAPEIEWQIDLLTVYIDTNKRQGRVIPFWNVVF